MSKKLSGWMRIWLVLSAVWVVTMLVLAVGDFNESASSTESAHAKRTEQDRTRTEIRELNPAWSELPGLFSSLDIELAKKGLHPLPKDPYIAQEYRKEWEALPPNMKKIYTDLSKTMGKTREGVMSVPKSVEHYMGLIAELDAQASIAWNWENAAKEERESAWRSLISAMVGPFLALGITKLLLLVFHWIKNGF